MSKGERITERAVDIDYQSTQAFFDARGTGTYSNPLSATMYQDNEPDLVAKRDIAEKNVIASYLTDVDVKTVLDLGCGIGRWAWSFSGTTQSAQYPGIDFSSSLIAQAQKIAAEQQIAHAQFQVMSVTELDITKLLLAPPFDLIIISGVMMYLNDDDCENLLTQVLRLIAPTGQIYLREPLAEISRLTLQDIYSEELKNAYSAIYRTKEEMDGMLNKHFIPARFRHLGWKNLFEDELEKRKETRQNFTVLSRGQEE